MEPEPTPSDEKHPPRRKGLSLGQRLLVLFVVFSLGPLFISNLWGYLQTRDYLTEAVYRNVQNVGSLAASQTAQFVRAKRDLVPSIVAGNEHLFSLVRGLTSSLGAEEDLEAALRSHLSAKAAEDAAVFEFAVVSPDGRLLGSSREERVPASAVIDASCRPRVERGPHVVGFEYGGAEPLLVVSAPIVDGAGGYLGGFCARFRFNIHHKLVYARRERTTNANILLLNASGEVLCSSFESGDHTSKGPHDHGSHSDDSRDDDGAVGWNAPYGHLVDLVSRGVVVGPEPWVGEYALPSGGRAIAAYAPVAGLGWGILVEVPVAVALSDLDDLRTQAIGLFVLLVALLILALFFSTRTIVRPVQALSSAAQRLAEGSLDQHVSPRGPPELVDLATVFNRMSHALSESTRLLEMRVAVRTRSLRESQELAELLVDSIEQRVVVLNRDHRIIKANSTAERLHGEGLVGREYHEVFEGVSEQCEDCPASRTFETGQPAAAERPQHTLTGQEIFHVECYPVRLTSSRVASVVEIGRQVTGERRLQAQMLHQEKMAAFGLLAAGVAHEIGNPLAAIESQLRMTREADDPQRVSRTLQVVGKEVGRISRLLRELVDFTRRRRDELTLVSLNQVADDVARLIRHDPRARTVVIERRLMSNLPGVRAREDHLVQVLLNLAINALDGMPDGGTLVFETSVDGDIVALRVRDTGVGIDAQARSRLFEPFFTTKSPGTGTGLGLFVSRGIVEGDGGSLILEESKAGGTTFLVRLPIARATGKRATA